MIGAVLMSSGPALSGNDGCADPIIGKTRECTDARAARIAGTDTAWLTCGGGCIVSQTGPDAAVLDERGELRKEFPDMRFLPGNGRTDCLAALAFLRSDGLLTVLGAGNLAPRETHALSNLYAVDFGAEPGLLETVLLEGRLSCDGRRFFAPSLDGIGFAVLELGSGEFGATALEDAPQVVIVSPSGRFGLGVDSQGDGTYGLLDFETGNGFATDAVFELDVPFFDIDEAHLLIRKGELPEAEITVYNLSDGSEIGRAPYPAEGGFRFRFADGQLIPVPGAQGQ